ncbi:MAG TPA: hypothetical protein VGI10_17640 [Polyangiaceae bacterium]|jgi:alpha-tubulin suppressor-like RCC1 family protein
MRFQGFWRQLLMVGGFLACACGRTSHDSEPLEGGTVVRMPTGCAAVGDACDADAGGDSGIVTSVASGLYHTCALFADGTVKCWGDNSYGQLGTGVGCLQKSSAPLPVSHLRGVKALSAGDLHTCALLVDGTVACWGEVPGGLEDSTTPTTIDAGSDVQCPIIISTGAPEGFGSMPGAIPGLSGVVSIAAGNDVDCAVSADGTARCWGWVGGGGLGNGTGLSETATGPSWVTTPTVVSGFLDVASVATGSFFGCEVLRDTTVACWGQNESGELGDGTTNASAIPVPVRDLSGVSEVTTAENSGSPRCAACYAYACALLADGTVQCWGEDQDGTLGNGTTAPVATTTPAAVSNLGAVASLSAGPGHIFAILTDGTVAAWGANRCGELGDGTTTDATEPIYPKALAHVASISSGECHACAALVDGSVVCWGDNGEGQLGSAVAGGASLTPVPVEW